MDVPSELFFDHNDYEEAAWIETISESQKGKNSSEIWAATIMALREGELATADEEKQKVEQNQRERLKTHPEEDHVPTFFVRSEDPHLNWIHKELANAREETSEN